MSFVVRLVRYAVGTAVRFVVFTTVGAGVLASGFVESPAPAPAREVTATLALPATVNGLPTPWLVTVVAAAGVLAVAWPLFAGGSGSGGFDGGGGFGDDGGGDGGE